MLAPEQAKLCLAAECVAAEFVFKFQDARFDPAGGTYQGEQIEASISRYVGGF